jgi:hypothetical protein
MAPDIISSASSSVFVPQSSSSEHDSDGAPTFKPSLTVRSPSSNLSSNLPFPVHDEHGHTGVGKVGYALVSDDGNKFSTRMACRQRTDVNMHTITPGDSVAKLELSARKRVKYQAYPSLYKKQTTPVPCDASSPGSSCLLASVTSRV